MARDSTRTDSGELIRSTRLARATIAEAVAELVGLGLAGRGTLPDSGYQAHGSARPTFAVVIGPWLPGYAAITADPARSPQTRSESTGSDQP